MRAWERAEAQPAKVLRGRCTMLTIPPLSKTLGNELTILIRPHTKPSKVVARANICIGRYTTSRCAYFSCRAHYPKVVAEAKRSVSDS
jgi:hypothetical protein